MVRLDGQGPAAAGRPGLERRCHCLPGRTDSSLRAGLLLGHLPDGRLPGHRLLAERTPQRQEKPLRLQKRDQMAALRHAGPVHRADDCRLERHRPADCPLQRLGPYRHQHAGAGLRLVQQSAGSHLDPFRQLRLLSHGSLSEEPAGPDRGRRYLYYYCSPGLAGRPHLVQHRLPGRYDARPALAFCDLPSGDQYRQMRQLRRLRQALQGILHRHEEPRH